MVQIPQVVQLDAAFWDDFWGAMNIPSISEKYKESSSRLWEIQAKRICGAIVDRGEALREVYCHFKDILQDPTLSRKPLISLSAAPGGGKTVFTSLLANLVDPCLSSKTIDPRMPASSVDYFPIYVPYF